jgi:hypothetical protein
MNALQQVFGYNLWYYVLLTYLHTYQSFFDGVMRVHIMLISVSDDRELSHTIFGIKFFFPLWDTIWPAF